MGLLTIHPDRSTPLADQIASALRRAIATDAVRVGDELPPVRQLATDLAVNLNTVSRAYQALQEAGLIRTARGRGTRVVRDRETGAAAGGAQAAPLDERCLDWVASAKLAGLDAEATRAMFEQMLAACHGTSVEESEGDAA